YNGYKFGADFFVHEWHTVGFLLEGAQNTIQNTNTSYANITSTSTGAPVSNLDALSDNDGSRENLHSNINYRFDNLKGVTWNVDADYGRYDNFSNAYQPNTYYDPVADTVIFESIYASEAPTYIQLYTANIDHERSLWNGKLGAGIKYSYVITDNTYRFYNVVNNVYETDPERSNQFVYDENVNAAYIHYAFAIKKINISLGVRGEQTRSAGKLTSTQDTGNDEVARDYFDLFPSGGIAYNLNPQNAFRLNYSRRIQRPNYQDLNPFEYKINELSYYKGNPFLQPQYTQSLQLSHTYHYSLTTTLRYSYTTDFFSNVTDTAEGGASYLQTLNIGTQQVVGINVSYPLHLTKWWSTYTNAGVVTLYNEGVIAGDREISLQRVTFNAYHQSAFTVKENLSFELSGWFNSPSVWGAVFQTDANWSVDVGAQYTLFKKRG
ncbi:MAG: outer membrane beta-barrel family protein, partial [Chitinophagales bacterium]